MTISVSLENLDNLNLQIAITRPGRPDMTHSTDQQGAARWLEVVSRKNPIYLYITDDDGLYAGRVFQKDGELLVRGGRSDLKQVGVI